MTAAEFTAWFSSADDVLNLLFSVVGLGWFAGVIALAVQAVRPRG